MITIVTPTYNEADSIVQLLPKLAALEGVREVIVVDDNSPDKTALIASNLGLERVTVYCRLGERGLASAVRYGAERASTVGILVMDSDGQHTSRDAARLIEAWDSDSDSDLVVGSRFCGGANLEGLPLWRRVFSLTLTFVLKTTLRTKASDPLTGFFLTRKDVILGTKARGFKILYDILIHHNLTWSEVSINFAKRSGGSSKASVKELWEVFKLACLRSSA